MRFELDPEDRAAIAAAVTAEVLKALKPLLVKEPLGNTLMTVEEVADYLKASPGWIYKRTQLKEIPFIKLGRFCMFEKDEVDAWIRREGKMPQCADISAPLRTNKKLNCLPSPADLHEGDGIPRAKDLRPCVGGLKNSGVRP